MPELNIQTKPLRDDAYLFTLEGFLDAHTFEQLDETIQSIFEKNVFNIVADMTGVEYISSAGAGVFIGSLSVAQEGGGNIVLVNPTENVREVFDLLGLSQIFMIEPDIDAALAKF